MRAATAAALPPEEPPGVRARSHGLRVGPKALFSLDEPIANSSMFVLPTITASAARRRAIDGGVVRRDVAGEDLRPRRRFDPARADGVLDGDGHACERPEGFAARALLVDRARLRQRLVARDAQERVHLAVERGDARERLLRGLLGRELACLHPRRDRGHALVTRHRDPSLEKRGYGEAIGLDLRRLRQRLVVREARGRPRLAGAGSAPPARAPWAARLACRARRAARRARRRGRARRRSGRPRPRRARETRASPRAGRPRDRSSKWASERRAT